MSPVASALCEGIILLPLYSLSGPGSSLRWHITEPLKQVLSPKRLLPHSISHPWDWSHSALKSPIIISWPSSQWFLTAQYIALSRQCNGTAGGLYTAITLMLLSDPFFTGNTNISTPFLFAIVCGAIVGDGACNILQFHMVVSEYIFSLHHFGSYTYQKSLSVTFHHFLETLFQSKTRHLHWTS